MKTARQAAVQALMAVDAGSHAQAAVAAAAAGLGAPDARLCTDLLYGVLRGRGSVRREIAAVMPRPGRLPPFMRAALELAVYALLFQDRVPAYAVVNETVILVRKKFGQKLANAANAVLRKIAARVKSSAAPDGVPENIGINGIAQGGDLPAWLLDLWTNAYGRENAANLAIRSARRPYGALRLNPLALGAREVGNSLQDTEAGIAIGVSGFAFPPGKMPQLLNGHRLEHWLAAGVLSRQAAGSQLVLEQLGLFTAWQDVPIWDACAGFGGKTALMLEQGLCVALASDVSLKRLSHLPQELLRLNLPSVPCVVCDARVLPLSVWQGHILVDAPCSGLGVLARRPDLRMRQATAAAAMLADLQTDLLAALTCLLETGRELAWITCTLNPAENEDQIAAFLAAHRNFELIRSWQTPHDHPWLEGMYGARLRKMA